MKPMGPRDLGAGSSRETNREPEAYTPCESRGVRGVVRGVGQGV